MPPRHRALLLLVGGIVAAAAFACGGDGSGSATPVATRTAPVTESTGGLGPPAPEAERIDEHIRVLSGEIGVRTAGSPEEREAAQYAQSLFQRWGYQVEVQRFQVSHDLLRTAAVSTDDQEFQALPFVGAASGSVTAPLVDAGTGRAEEFPPQADGAVVLIQRQDVPFVDMASRARAAGARAVIVANKAPELFQGGFSDPFALPFVAIDQRDGAALHDLLAAGPVEVTVQVQAKTQRTARNVVARPRDGVCRTISGGHFDSVPVSPGANDNASGAGTVLELARAAAAAGFTDHCFVLFGAEEIGLVGSQRFVERLSEREAEEIVAVFNYDVVGGVEPVALIGDRGLAAQADRLADDLGFAARPDTLPETASSDHASFLDAGIPALMISTHGFDRIHTARDTVRNLEPRYLDDIAHLGFALLAGLGG